MRTAYTQYLRADRGCPTKAGLLLVITVRSCLHSPDDPRETRTYTTLTQKYRHQTNPANTTKPILKSNCASGAMTLCTFCWDYYALNTFFSKKRPQTWRMIKFTFKKTLSGFIQRSAANCVRLSLSTCSSLPPFWQSFPYLLGCLKRRPNGRKLKPKTDRSAEETPSSHSPKWHAPRWVLMTSVQWQMVCISVNVCLWVSEAELAMGLNTFNPPFVFNQHCISKCLAVLGTWGKGC